MTDIVEGAPTSPRGDEVKGAAASSFEGGIMESDARHLQTRGPSSWSAARRLAEAALLHTLERVTRVDDDKMRPAVRTFVEALVKEGLTPEAAVIALKETFGRAHSLHRFEPLVREQMRAEWVSECIDHYFVARTADDVAPRRTEPARPQRETPRLDDASRSPSP
jgi:hypothetical protein